SPEMLRLARGRIGAAGLAHAEVRRGDMFALPHGDASMDTVVLHQVLHFADAPSDAIAEAARVLAPGGRLLVVDFAPHDREELRTTQAHARLGFEGAGVTGWLDSYGLHARGAGGSAGGRPPATAARIVRETGIPAAAHLTCVDASRDEIDAVARAYWEAGVRHIVALRGDPPRAGEKFTARPDGYASAADLVA